MKKVIIYGAGNIGRGFIGQLLSQSGYEVVFVDVNTDIVNALNRDREYPVRIVSDSGYNEFFVKNVSAVDGSDIGRVAELVAEADLMATAVGVNVLPKIIKPISLGLKKRWEKNRDSTLNIIICENLINADKYIKELIIKELDVEGKEDLINERLGLVEASIGRMVPVMTPEMQEGNILRICAEEYCELPVDGQAFKGEIPEIQNMVPFSPFQFYIERKLFIHNMGHAISAYLGHLNGYCYIWESAKDPFIKLIMARAMQESAIALSREHGFSLEKILQYIDELVYRFGNRNLCDTIERVGRDPVRKLSANDRLVGALRLCNKNGVSPVYICLGIAAALCFDKECDSSAVTIQDKIFDFGMNGTLYEICGLSRNQYYSDYIVKFYKMIKRNMKLDEVLYEAETLKNKALTTGIEERVS